MVFESTGMRCIPSIRFIHARVIQCGFDVAWLADVYGAVFAVADLPT